MKELKITTNVGRLGNVLYQLYHVIYLANKNKCIINIGSIKHYLDIIINSDDLEKNYNSQYNNYDKNNLEIIEDTFFYLYIENCNDYFAVGKYISKFLHPIFDNPYDDNTLVIHIRSGDIFDKMISNDSSIMFYYPYPINFYTKIISENLQYDKIIICSEKIDCNYVNKLKLLNPNIEIKQSDLLTDISHILNAKNIIASKSSFIISLIYLSKFIKNVYVMDSYLRSYPLNLLQTKLLPINIINYKCLIPFSKLWFNTKRQNNKILHNIPSTCIVKSDREQSNLLGNFMYAIMRSHKIAQLMN